MPETVKQGALAMHAGREQMLCTILCFSISSFACLQISAEEQKKMDEKVMVDGVKRVVSKLLARRKLKRSYEYEVQWEGQPSSSDYTAWLSRDRSVSILCNILSELVYHI